MSNQVKIPEPLVPEAIRILVIPEIAASWQDHAGYLPEIFQQAYQATQTDSVELIPAIEAAYGFPLCSIDEGSVKDGMFHYPDDAPMKPIIHYIFPNDSYVIQYAYGFVAICIKDREPKIFRMD